MGLSVNLFNICKASIDMTACFDTIVLEIIYRDPMNCYFVYTKDTRSFMKFIAWSLPLQFLF